MRSLILAAALLAGPAQADIMVTFRDGAPKDTFSIKNFGTCMLGPVALTIDLEPSPAGLIFDVTAQGQGVEVFQPFELVMGQQLVGDVSPLGDGDQRLTMGLTQLFPLAEVRFTIDLDDTIGAREITVSGSEIAGAQVLLDDGMSVMAAVFDDTGTAMIETAACVS